MTEVMNGLVQEAKKSKYSSIGPTLSDEDIVSVWDNVSSFIEKQMSQQKGVSIPGLGTFAFSQKKLDVGNNKYILIQRPVFLLSEKFAQTHGLNYTKHHITGQIPIVQLNFAALSFESPFDRDTVEACVKEVLGALARSVATKRNVEFTFSGIGRLQIREQKTKMKFYKEFINSMDGSGKLVDALKDRPGTVDSVCSERTPTRSATANTLVLPRITQGLGGLEPEKQPMPTIREDGVEDAAPQYLDEEPIGEEAAGGEHQEEAELMAQPQDEEDKRPSPGPVASRSGSRIAAPIAKATGVSFADDLIPQALQSPKGLRGTAASRSPTPMMFKRSLSPIPQTNRPSPPPGDGRPDFDRAKSVDSLNLDKIRKPSPLQHIPTPPAGDKPSSAPGSSCGHPNAGQELCYLCHQRDRRNIPVSFTEERKRREQEEDRLLQQFQHMKDTEAIVKESTTNMAKRHHTQKMAAFNLGVSEAVKIKQNSRDLEFHPSYIFQRRPLTPPKFIKQEQYFSELGSQVGAKEDSAKKRKADEQFLERLEQVQLAEDLAAQREQYLFSKVDQQEQYKRALSAQIMLRDSLMSPSDLTRIRLHKRLGPLALPRPHIILPFSESYTMKIQEGSGTNKKLVRFKPLPMPAKYPDSSEPVFGKNDLTNEKMLERRRVAHDLYKEQIDTVEQRKRDAILRRLQDQKDEEGMLDRTKKELLDDRADRYERLFINRRRLEDDWLSARDLKKKRDLDDKARSQSPGMLLHEQCDRYKRCDQCKRKMQNCGESNIWRESRYIPGSRLIV